jgi:signal transduction histidine kinase
MSASSSELEAEPTAGASRAQAKLVVATVCLGMALLIGIVVMIVALRPAPSYPWSLLLVAAPTLLVGGLICLRRPAELVGRLLLWIGVAMCGMIALGEYATYSTFGRATPLPFTGAAAWLSSVLQAAAVFSILVVLVVFPTGHLLSRRWRPLTWALVVAGVNAFAVTAFGGPMFDSNLDTIHNPLGIAHPGPLLVGLVAVGNTVTFLAIGGAAAQLIVRLVRSRGDEHEQLKWFVYVAVVGPLLLWILPGLVPSSWSQPVGDVVWTLVPIALIASIAVAILKYRLYDIDVVIRRTVVFALLALFITAVYAIVVAGVGAVIGRQSGLLAFVAAVVVAIAFQPVRERARRVADRLVYGRRATPYEVLTELSSQLALTASTDEALPRIARIVGEGTGARRAQVWVRAGGSLVPSATWPADGTTPFEAVAMTKEDLPDLPATQSFPVAHAGVLLGAIALDEDPADPLTPAKSRLVNDVAGQAGLVMRNVELVEDLRASRLRIVAAQAEERRRIQRSLEEGAERDLADIERALHETEGVAEDEAPAIAGSVRDLRAETDSALENLRGLAGGVYPAMLENRGVVPALEVQAASSPVPVDVSGDLERRFAIDVEAAAYFCALEAIQNALKYANASRIRVRLDASESSLAFEVADDGDGFDPAATGYGTGLQGIADRLDAFGGVLDVRSAPGAGTIVAGRVAGASRPSDAALEGVRS